MAGINVSGLFSNSFDWQTVVDKLMEVSSAPKVKLQREQAANTDKMNALAEIKTAMYDLQEAARGLWDSDLYAARTVTSDTAGSTWRANSSAGAEIGNYRVAVTRLATAARLQGGDDIGSGLTGSTVATLNTATAVTAGNFTINGRSVTVSASDSLNQVLAAIGTATDGDVTAAYDAGTDRIVLSSASPLRIGAASDTSNFLAAMRLTNNVTFANGSYSVASEAALGTVRMDGPLESAGLRTGLTETGSFSINGVAIAYDPAVDSLDDVLDRINASAAGVRAGYDPSGDAITLVNATTGDFGIHVSEASPGFLAAVGLTDPGAVFTAGRSAQFSVNGGPARTSASNTLDAAALGVKGLSVTVTTETTQALAVATDTTETESALEAFVEKYNAFQALIDGYTAVTSTGDTVTAAILAGDREVEDWGRQVRALAFNAVSSATGTVKRLDDLGFDFNGTENALVLKDPAKLAAALIDHPEDVAQFFQSGTDGFTARLHTYLTQSTKEETDAQGRLGLDNTKIDRQIEDLQRRLDSEREQLMTAFLKMQDAQSKARNQSTYLTNTFFRSSSN